jgi:hypothetical protein
MVNSIYRNRHTGDLYTVLSVTDEVTYKMVGGAITFTSKIETFNRNFEQN